MGDEFIQEAEFKGVRKSHQDADESDNFSHSESPNTNRNMLSPAYLARLQRTVGNQAVLRSFPQLSGKAIQRQGENPTAYPPFYGVGVVGVPLPVGVDYPGSQLYPLAETGKQGNKATYENLRPLVENRLETWKRAAERGIQNFIDVEIINMIKNPEFDAIGFIGSLIGNIIWAAASFETGGAAFAIALTGVAGITVATSPKENKSDNSLQFIEKQIQEYVDKIHNHLTEQITPSIENAIKAYPDKGVNAVLHRIMGASFKQEYLTILENPPWRSEIREEAVRNSFQNYASHRLENYREFTKTGKYASFGPGIIRIKDNAMLALGEADDAGNWSVIKLIPSEDHDYALQIGKERWKQAGGWWEGVGENPLKTGALYVISLGARQPETNWVKWTEAKPIPEFDSDQILGGVPVD